VVEQDAIHQDNRGPRGSSAGRWQPRHRTRHAREWQRQRFPAFGQRDVVHLSIRRAQAPKQAALGRELRLSRAASAQAAPSERSRPTRKGVACGSIYGSRRATAAADIAVGWSHPATHSRRRDRQGRAVERPRVAGDQAVAARGAAAAPLRPFVLACRPRAPRRVRRTPRTCVVQLDRQAISHTSACRALLGEPRQTHPASCEGMPRAPRLPSHSNRKFKLTQTDRPNATAGRRAVQARAQASRLSASSRS
jgi:hypothetical protein